MRRPPVAFKPGIVVASAASHTRRPGVAAHADHVQSRRCPTAAPPARP
ncbi:hypothetical protein I35_6620 [Burkholderia cenocepacia H111]|nr:uncharacterized protein BCN122_II3177 [Burkholderia cenocepacia]CDN64456.1 hypothetical protein I35_6620 [Burkholderia cenocepacia H111]